MKITSLIVSIGLLLSLGAQASEGEHICKQGKAERKVTIHFPEAGKKTPCEVKYLKEGATEEKVLYQAQNEEGYCDKKAHEFMEKLKASGWECPE